MIAVIFEVQPHADRKVAYLDAAASLRPLLDSIDGFLSIERFESLTTPGKVLSLSFWRDEEAVARWRNLEAHRAVQEAGRRSIFADYRLRVAHVVRDYGMNDRAEAPADSRRVHDGMPPEGLNRPPSDRNSKASTGVPASRTGPRVTAEEPTPGCEP
jgi:heme-degrading monooxygenase HmoA